jgi:hypothetical protein
MTSLGIEPETFSACSLVPQPTTLQRAARQRKFRREMNIKKVGTKQDVSIGKDSGSQDIREGEGRKSGGS